MKSSQNRKNIYDLFSFIMLVIIVVSDSVVRNHPPTFMAIKLISLPSIIIAFRYVSEMSNNNIKIPLRSLIGATLFCLLYSGIDTNYISLILVLVGVFACFSVIQLPLRSKFVAK